MINLIRSGALAAPPLYHSRMSQPSSSSSSSSSFYVVDYEKQFLSAVIRTEGAVLADTPHITAADFSETNRVVFNAIQSCLAGGAFNRFILVQKLNGLNIKIGGVIEPEIYVNAIADLNGVSDRAAIEISKQIKQVTIRRELDRTIDQMKLLVKNSKDMKASELVAAVTGAFNAKVNVFSGAGENEPVDLYASIRKFLDIDNSFSERAITPPFKILTDLYGFWDAGNTTVIASRMKIGKSSFWLSSAQQLAASDKNDEIRILVFDTELTVEENQSRSLAQISGVKEFKIRQGWYKKNAEEKRRVEAAAAYLEPITNRVHHCFCGGMELEEMLSVARRWAKKYLTPGKRGLIVWDYIKMDSGSDWKSKNSLSLVIGEKINAIKNLTKELKVHCLCFAQTNRENVDSKGGERQESSAVIGGSDMIAQFASCIFLLSELTPEDKMNYNQIKPGDATHSLKEIACRQRGPCELGEDRLVKYTDEKGKERFCKNYILLNFDSYNVREVSTFRQMVEKNKITGVNVQKPVAPVAPNTDGFTVL